MSNTHTLPETGRIDTLLSLLADGERRAIIAHLRETTRTDASLEELADALATHADFDREHARTRLHHSHLPMLADTTILEYDTDTSTIQYRGNPELESLMEAVQTLDATTAAAQPGGPQAMRKEPAITQRDVERIRRYLRKPAYARDRADLTPDDDV